MSRIITAVCLMLSITLYSVFAAFVIHNENHKISQIVDEISMHNKNGDSEKASAAAERLNTEWDKFEIIMTVFVRSDKINNLSSSVARVKPYVTEANDELEAELKNISSQLDLLYRAELPTWYNIL